uniref:Uncharacterized protein n=1 Tax=Arundo donax TaxID=35708 RepID=A0A0A9B970_ARUDO
MSRNTFGVLTMSTQQLGKISTVMKCHLYCHLYSSQLQMGSVYYLFAMLPS